VSAPLTPAQRQRASLLVTTRRRATGLLVAVTAVFVVSTVLAPSAAWLRWVQATAVASMVGGLADWFAVTALFRRPLGLPIPHTAIVVERKDRFAETLGSFVQESFLTPEAVSERLHAARAVERTAAWLADPAHAAELAERAARAVVAGADLLRDEDVHDVFATLVRQRVDSISLAPVAGRALDQLTRDGRYNPVLDTLLAGVSRYLDQHGTELPDRLGVQAPWWLPGPLESRVVAGLIRRGRDVLADMGADRHHPMRQQLESGLLRLAHDLQHSPEMRDRGEELKAELFGQAELRTLVSSVWLDTKTELRAQAATDGSELRRRLAGAVAQTGERLRDDPDLAARAERALDAALGIVLSRFDRELASLVSGTIARWDSAETSRRLELLLGPDLQYIRINGTVVGALAGLVLEAVTRLL
jgi:uncharacterized membrane-anchored protein YjiN (DUF445 family)